MQEPPYLKIAHEIRRRIDAGELPAGARVPSTRQISRDWGVAMATAAKALTWLHQQGLVRPQPRVGTVVTGAPAVRTPVPEPDLTRDRIVRAAIGIADAEGVAALSMRAVAARLGVATMTPYRYVGSKDDLIMLMADTVYGELRVPPVLPGGWRTQLEAGTRTLWAVHRRHPWLAQLTPLSRPLPLPNLAAHGERLYGALAAAGLPPAMMLSVNILLYSFVQGLAVQQERETQARATTGMSDEEWLDRQAPAMAQLTGSGRYPQFTAMLAGLGEGGYDFDLDALFDLGLRTLLDGLERLIPPPAS